MNPGNDILKAGRRSAVGIQTGAKSLLRNMIRHTDTHNRLLEESEMWQLHYKMKGIKDQRSSSEESYSRSSRKQNIIKKGSDKRGESNVDELNIERSFLFDDRRVVDHGRPGRPGCMKRAHMDEEERSYHSSSKKSRVTSAESERNSSSSSTYWQRQLLKAEAGDSDRWGHAGFKELYPQDFDSDRSSDNDDSKCTENSHTGNRRKKSSKKKKKKRKKKLKAKESDRVKKKKRMSEKEESLSSETESDSDNHSAGKVSAVRRTKKAVRSTDDESDLIQSHSESEADHRKKRRRKEKERKPKTSQKGRQRTGSKTHHKSLQEDKVRMSGKDDYHGHRESTPEGESASSDEETDSGEDQFHRKRKKRKNIKTKTERAVLSNGESSHRKDERRK